MSQRNSIKEMSFPDPLNSFFCIFQNQCHLGIFLKVHRFTEKELIGSNKMPKLIYNNNNKEIRLECDLLGKVILANADSVGFKLACNVPI